MSNKPNIKSRTLASLHTANIDWQDNTPRSSEFSDIYFSNNDSYNETQHVFIAANQLRERWKSEKFVNDASTFTIIETGFGTGLNFLATAELWLTERPWPAQSSDSGLLHYVSIEKFPLEHEDLSRALKAWPNLSSLSEQLISQYPAPLPGFHRLYLNDEHNHRRIALTLIFDEAERALEQLRSNDHPDFREHRSFHVDAWYLDGFAPAKNPTMWTQKVFQGMADLSGQLTTFSTFTAAGSVRRGLNNAGFEVNKIQGHGRKREMLVGVFKPEGEPEQTEASPLIDGHRKKHQAAPLWHIDTSPQARPIPPRSKNTKHAAIIGGGIAACSTARALALRGWQVTIYEKASSLGAGASGNPQGIIYPRLSTEASFLSRFNLTALLFASHFYKRFWDREDRHGASATGSRCGVLVLPDKATDQQAFKKIADNLSNCQAFIALLDQAQIQAVSGVALQASSALYFPSLGWIKPKQVCQQLSKHKNIQLVQDDISELLHDPDSNRWVLNSAKNRTAYNAQTVVLASSHHTNNFSPTRHLPLKAIRGQISISTATQHSQTLKTVICGAGYLAPANGGIHTLGATYDLHTTATDIRDNDHRLNLETLRLTDPALPVLLGQPQITMLEGRASLRCTTPDYLPIVGPAPNYGDFLRDYAPLRKDARADIPCSGSYWPGLYVHCGLGSRGFTYAPLGAELLAGLIDKEAPVLPRDLQMALHPARFIIRDLKRKRI